MAIQAPRGTHDVLPNQSAAWQHLEQVFREVSGRYGYQEIRTPVFESVEVFDRTAGETSDIVSKEMYTFTDRGDRLCALKPEGTAPIVRSVLEHKLTADGNVLRASYITPIFRYERPQKGRYRQAHQVGLELLNSANPAADAEIIEATVRFYEALGLEELSIRLNSLGRTECRERYRAAVLEHYQPYLATLEPEVRARMEGNPLRLLDSKDPKAIEARQGAPSILDFLEPEAQAHLAKVRQLLDEASVNYILDPGVIRGLDYYSDTVFEVTSDQLGAQSALCGGGRYDGLSQQLGGPSLPSVGVGMGIERALIVLEQLGKFPQPPKPDYFLISTGEQVLEKLRDVARNLRGQGYRVLYDLDARSVKSQMRQANSSEARFALIFGTDELSRQAVMQKELATGEQREIPLTDLVPTEALA